ncbi:MAG: aldehyde dehydrogenase family protein [Alphaproteobacteria bacterium]|nr:aldehyde dehydrogenase family protein [Alphaproteobacteria bacterium]
MSELKRNLIGGEWVGSDRVIENVNPSDTNDIVGRYAKGDAAAARQAIDAAADAFPGWAGASPQKRFEVLDAAGTEILAHAKELGTLLSREEGKTLAEGIGEATRAGQIFKFFAGEALRLGGETLASVRPKVDVEILRQPLGVVGLISPWNFPIAIPAWKTAPALAFGNTVVIKPAELVPGSVHALAEILVRAGAPKGVFNLVMGSGREVGQALVDSPKVKALSFTGSVETGRAVGAALMARGARVQLEMGGKNPLVVLDDADLKTAVECAVNGAFFSTGQRCTASSRLIVTKGIAAAFIEALRARTAALRIGPALDPETEIGPVADKSQLEKVCEYIEIGKKEGGRLHGGERANGPTPGYYLRPALFTETTSAMRINREEIFGPVASVIEVKDYDEALAVANDTEFGLSAGIVTTSLKYASDFKKRAEAGMVMVNLPTAGVDFHVPFGGTKGSSYGPREQGAYAREFYTMVKTAYVAP